MHLRLGPALLLSFALAGCSCRTDPPAVPDAASEAPDAESAGPDAAAPGPDAGALDAAVDPGADAAEPADAAPPGEDAGADAGADAGPACAVGSHADALEACLDSGTGPDACLAAVAAPLCDSDGDGLPDDLERALSKAYAPVFLFNGGTVAGSAESHWLANVKHFVERSQLFFRPTGASAVLADPAPSLAALGEATTNYLASTRSAADPALGQGADFWLCLKDHGSVSTVDNPATMLALPDGADVETVVHPANGPLADSSHLFVAFVPFWAFNAHSTVDDHEGDREILVVFVNRQTGAVDAVNYTRHGTMDGTLFVDVATYGAKDPALDVPTGNVNGPPDGVRGVRFWDFSGRRHHVAAYVSSGGHALYDFPGNTYIVYLGPRDTHNGDGARLVVGTGEFRTSPTAAPATLKVNLNNPGESSKILLPWARYRGQWGCQESVIANSFPGPFGNARHPRPVFEKLWGSPPRD